MTKEELEKFIPLTDAEIDDALREGKDLVERARRYSPSINLRRGEVYH